MAGYLSVVFTILSFCVTVAKAGDLSENLTNWITAKLSCEKVDKSLPQQNSELDDSVAVWIDGVVESSPWMFNAGCYKYESNNKNLNKFTILKELNSALACLKYCGNELPVGLLEGSCYCFKPDFNLEKASGVNCTIPCNGNSNDSCGGVLGPFDEYVTVYNGSHEIQTTDETFNGECLSVEIDSERKVYKSRNCTSMLHVLCQNITGDVEEIKTKTDWYGALQTCKSKNSELANDQFIVNKSKKHEYWVGYFRKSYPVWSNTSDVKNPSGCYLLVNGQHKVANCRQLNKFTCVRTTDKTLDSMTTLFSKSLTTRQSKKQKDEEDDLNVPVIIGVSVAGVLVIAFVVIAIIIICKRRRTNEYKNTNGTSKDLPIRGTNFEEGAALIDKGPVQKPQSKETDVYCEPGQLKQLIDKGPVQKPQSKETDVYCEPGQLEQPAKPEQVIDDGEYDHLQLEGQRVSFCVEDDNTYDVSGVDTYEISRIDKAHKPKTVDVDNTYDHASNVL